MLWAHSMNVNGERHRLGDHLRGTADLARRFADDFGVGDLGYGAGITHDVGKCTTAWQRRLDLLETQRPAPMVDHKTVGAWLFGRVAQAPGLLALLGHHSGMPDHLVSALGQRPTRDELQAVRDRLDALLPELSLTLDHGQVVPDSWLDVGEGEALDMRVHMLHSCLVDADYLDTAAHFNAKPVELRGPADFDALMGRFMEARDAFLATRAASPIDGTRQQLFEASLAAAEGEPGIYRLPGPTGSGKTISAAGFALRHAALHGKSRVIVAVPFLAVTTQNAAVLRSLVGDENMIEQHSAVEPRGLAKVGVENWDAPLVVTTTVQLFESLLSHTPAKARKLHNIVNSVVVLDELQAIPIRVLPVVVDVLRILVRYFGVTVLLSSATQPAWDQLSAWRDDREIEVHDVVADTKGLYRSLRRTQTSWVDVETVSQLASLVLAEPSALVIVNKTKQARDLTRLLTELTDRRVLHLSTRMYPAHRAEVLAVVKRLLAAGERFYLVSTQLVEAGVDIDFPVVFRLMAPAENLQQAAGRCNREGTRERGRLVAVNCAEWTPLRDYVTGIAKTNQYFRLAGAQIDEPDVMDAYFADYYRTADVDGQDEAREVNEARRNLLMSTVGKSFRIIEDDSFTVVVGQVPEAQAIMAEMRRIRSANGTPSRSMWRELQQYCVSLPPYLKDKAGTVEELPGVFVSGAWYDSVTGIDVDAGGANDSIW